MSQNKTPRSIVLIGLFYGILGFLITSGFVIAAYFSPTVGSQQPPYIFTASQAFFLKNLGILIGLLLILLGVGILRRNKIAFFAFFATILISTIPPIVLILLPAYILASYQLIKNRKLFS